jgi:hypothetical protein
MKAAEKAGGITNLLLFVSCFINVPGNGLSRKHISIFKRDAY